MFLQYFHNAALIMAGLILPLTAMADELAPEGFDFSLQLSRYKTLLDYGSSEVTTTNERLGIFVIDRSQSWLSLGYKLGYSSITQSNHPPIAGLNPSGFYLGLLASNQFFDTSWFRVWLDTEYTFQYLSDENQDETVTDEWHELDLKLTLLVKASKRIGVYGGINYGLIDGTEKIRNSLHHTIGFDRKPKVGGLLGIRLMVDRGGAVGIEAQTGITKGVLLFFERQYRDNR